MHRLLFILFLVWLSTSLSAQTPLTFSGLKRTQVAYFSARIEGLERIGNGQLESLILEKGRSDRASIERLRQDLVNLPAVTRAEYEWLVTETGDSTLHWTIQEGRTLFPVINFGGIKGNFNYQLGFNDIHWRGRGQELSGFYRNIDGQHNYSILLRNRSVSGGRWGYGIGSQLYAAVEPVYFTEGTANYRYANLGFEGGASYSPRPHQTLSLGVNFFRERYEKQNPELSPGLGPDELELFKFSLKGRYDVYRVDYHDERRAGWAFANNGQLVHNLNDNTDFLIILSEIKAYKLLGSRGNLALRARAGLSSNQASPFAPFTIDSQLNIRGSGNRIDRGTAQFVLNLEYRHTFWKERKNRFSAQVVGFSDFGTWRSPGGSLEDLIDGNYVRHFVGGGIRLISSSAKDAVLRLDYGVDVRNSRERGLVLGFGQYF